MNTPHNINRRFVFLGALASTAALGAALAATAANPSSIVSTLFPEWLALRDTSDDASFARYLDLQARITSAPPASARELAMQWVVETDDGDSDFRDVFFARIRSLAMEG